MESVGRTDHQGIQRIVAVVEIYFPNAGIHPGRPRSRMERVSRRI